LEREFCLALKERGLHGVELVISDDDAGLRKAIAEVFTEGLWQRCYVHFLRNAPDYLLRKADNDCMTELRGIYDRRSIEEARQDLAAWLKKWSSRYPKVCDWVETKHRRDAHVVSSARLEVSARTVLAAQGKLRRA
jgi:transposase-like protein